MNSLIDVPAVSLPEVAVGDLEAALERMGVWYGQAKGAFSAATERAWKGDLKTFARWCHARGMAALPAKPETVAAYLRARAEVPGHVLTTLQSPEAIAAWAAEHRLLAVATVRRHRRRAPGLWLARPMRWQESSGGLGAQGRLPRKRHHPEAGARGMPADETVRNYKALANVERAFRSLKSIDLEVRPIHHRLEDRVRAHIFICMLAYYVEWHMREALRPLLLADEDQKAKATRDPVAPAKRSTRLCFAHRLAPEPRARPGVRDGCSACAGPADEVGDHSLVAHSDTGRGLPGAGGRRRRPVRGDGLAAGAPGHHPAQTRR